MHCVVQTYLLPPGRLSRTPCLQRLQPQPKQLENRLSSPRQPPCYWIGLLPGIAASANKSRQKRSKALRNTPKRGPAVRSNSRSEEHTYELQSPDQLVCLLLLEKK